jgi:hypothetical protein
MTEDEGKRVGRAAGDRGYGPQLQQGAGARMLATYMTALAAKHATFAEQIGRVRQALTGMADAREQFDMARRDARKQWAPHPVPLADRMKVDAAKARARDLIDSRASQASVGLWHLRQAAQAEANFHRPVVSEEQRKAARDTVTSLAPASWPAAELPGRRARLVRGALQSGDVALADELLHSSVLDTLQAAAQAPTLSGTGNARATAEAARAQQSVWAAEKVALLKELASDNPEAVQRIDEWQQVQAEADELDGLIAHERGRMLDGDRWEE